MRVFYSRLLQVTPDLPEVQHLKEKIESPFHIGLIQNLENGIPLIFKTSINKKKLSIHRLGQSIKERTIQVKMLDIVHSRIR